MPRKNFKVDEKLERYLMWQCNSIYVFNKSLDLLSMKQKLARMSGNMGAMLVQFPFVTCCLSRQKQSHLPACVRCYWLPYISLYGRFMAPITVYLSLPIPYISGTLGNHQVSCRSTETDSVFNIIIQVTVVIYQIDMF